MLSKKIFITGSSGLLGFNLALILHRKGFKNIVGQYFQSNHYPQFVNTLKIDLTNFDSLQQNILEYKPDVIINCAAMTNVDQCEKIPEIAFASNSLICQNLVKAAREFPCRIIHISTDQLWGGDSQFLTEKDIPAPINVYGNSKFEGENQIKNHDNHLIVRTNFFGGDLPWRKSFTGWLKSNFEQQQNFDSFDNVYFTPIGLPVLIEILIKAIFSDIYGLYHLGGDERLSKYEFALKYAQIMNYNHNLIRKTSYDVNQFVAARPKDMSLNSEAIANALKINLPNINESLESTFLYDNVLSTLKIF